MDRRSFIAGAAASAGLVLTHQAQAQGAFPTRPVTIINAFPPGGANDIVTRPFASALETVFGQAVVVEAKPGAGGQVGAQVAANAKADGYTLLSHNNGISGYAEVDKLFGRKPKVTRTDFIPLARLVANPVALVVNEQQPFKTLDDFVAAAKKKPESIVYSSGGLYGATHLPVAMMEKALGISKLRHLPTNGGGPAVTAVLGNNAHASVQTITATIQHIRAGKLRALAQFGAKRSKDLPDVPTMMELGHDVEYYLWVGIFAPKNTPADVVATLSAAAEKAGRSEQFSKSVSNLGLEVAFLNASEFAKFWENDARRSEEAVQLIGRSPT